MKQATWLSARTRAGRALLLLLIVLPLCGPPRAQGETEGSSDPEAAYFGDNYREALRGYLRLAESRPDDPLVAYRTYFSLEKLPGRDGEARAARERALELLERVVSEGPDPVAVYYLGVLAYDEDPQRCRALYTAEVDRQLPRPDPTLDTFALSRLAEMASWTDRDGEEQALLVRAMLEAGGGAWIDHPLLEGLPSLLARVAEAAGNHDEYAAALDRAVEARPDSAELRLARGDYLSRIGRDEEAARDVRAALEAGLTQPGDLENAGRLMIRFDLFEEAPAVLERALEIAPYLADAWVLLGQALFYLDREAEAVEAYGKALDLEPDDAWTHVMLGKALRYVDREDDAGAAFRRAVELSPQSQWVRRSLAEWHDDRDEVEQALATIDVPPFENELETETSVLRARYLWRLDRNEEAIGVAEAAIPGAPDERRLHYYLSRSLEDRGADGDLERALEAMNRAVELAPDNRFYRGDVARCLWRLDRDEEAVALLERVLGEHPDYLYGWWLAGEIFNHNGYDPERAVDWMTRAVEQLPDDADLWKQLGLGLSALSKREEAIAAFRRALELQPDDPDRADTLAVELDLAGRYEEELAVVEAALQRSPESATLHWRRGIALDNLGRTQEALEALRATVALAPEFASAHNSLGVVLSRLDRRDEAATEFRRAMELRPGFLRAQRNLASVLYQGGEQDEEALRLYEDCLAADPGDTLAALRRGLLLRRLGRADEAIEALALAGEMDGADGEAWIELGDLLLERDRADEALAAFERAEADPEREQLSVERRVGLLSGEGRHLAGAELIQSRIDGGHETVYEWTTLAIFLRDLEAYDRARSAAQKGIEADPSSGRAWAVLGDIENQTGHDAEAAEAYGRAVELDPSLRAVWVGLARRRLALDEPGAAIEAAEAAREIEDDATVRRLLADCHEAAGREKQADRHWKKAVELAPADAGLLMAAAAYQQRRGRTAAASELLLDAAEAAPDRADVQLELGRSLLRQGQEERAAEALQRVLELEPSRDEAERELRRLSAGRPRVAAFLDALHPEPLALDPFDPLEVLAAFDAEKPIYQGQDAAYLLDHSQLEILEDGRLQHTYHGMIKLFTEQAGEYFGEIRFPFNADRDRLEIHTARTHLPDGRVVEAGEETFLQVSPADTETSNLYSDSKIQVISMPAVQPGAVLEWRYTIREERTLFGLHWWRDWSFDGYIPIALSRLTLRVPRALDFAHRLLNIELEPEIKEEADHRVYAWTAIDRPALADEPAAPSAGDSSGQLQLTSMKEWEEVARWWDELSRNRFIVESGVEKEVAGLLAGVEEDEEKLRLLTDLVRTRVRYVGIEFGVGGFQPRPAQEVWETGYGDCKDKATLLVTLLRGAGIPAHAALVRTSSRVTLEHWLPSPGLFDHVIVFVPGVRGGIFVDPTVPLMDFADLPPEDQGAPALIVHADGGEAARVPVLPASTTGFRVRRALDLSDPDLARVTDRAHARGFFGLLTRLIYGRATREEQEQLLDRDILSEFPAATRLRMDVSNARDTGSEALVVQEFEVPDLLQPLADGQFLLSLSDVEELGELVEIGAEETRETDYVVPFRFQVDYVSSVTLPDGWTVTTHPAATEFENAVGRLSKRLERTETGFEVKALFELNAESVPRERYGELVALMREVGRYQTWTILLSAPAE